MTEPLMSCGGFSLGGVEVPPFDLHRGELVCLHWPRALDWTERDELAALLSGAAGSSAVRIEGATVRRATVPSGPASVLRPSPTARAFLLRAGVAEASVDALLDEMDIGAAERLSHISATGRACLGVEAAGGESDVLIFGTDALDPLGRLAVCERVRRKVGAGGAIHLSYPLIDKQHVCCPGSRCIQARSPTVRMAMDGLHVQALSDVPTFDEAAERFRGFLRQQGIADEVLWVFREDVSVKGRRGEAWVRLPLPERNTAFARVLYEKGRAEGNGVMLAVFCVVGRDACSYVWVPEDRLDAQYALLAGLKLSAPQPSRRGRPFTRRSFAAIRHWLSRPRPDPWLDELPIAGAAWALTPPGMPWR